jgi:hypothetical protein
LFSGGFQFANKGKETSICEQICEHTFLLPREPMKRTGIARPMVEIPPNPKPDSSMFVYAHSTKLRHSGKLLAGIYPQKIKKDSRKKMSGRTRRFGRAGTAGKSFRK